MIGRVWHRVRGSGPNLQTWKTAPYDAHDDVAASKKPSADDTQLKHANQQVAQAGQYPGRERSLPSPKLIVLDPTKQ
jgi:hypothetical protein